MQFDSATFGILGTITGTFIGSGGNTHSFMLALTDIVGTTGTWTFTNNKLDSTGAIISTTVGDGTYTGLVPAVAELATLTLLGLGLAGLAATRRRKLR